MMVLPRFNLLTPMRVLNSLCRVKMVLIQTTLKRLGTSQKTKGSIINTKKVLNQLIDKEKIVVEGSKTEKRFVIIFN